MRFTLEDNTNNNYVNNLSEQALDILHRRSDQPTQKLINLVAKQKFDINTPLNEENETALMIAVRHGDHELTELILILNANVNLLDSNEHSALTRAALADNTEIVNLLFKTGATCTYTKSDGKQSTFLIQHGAELSLEMIRLCITHLKLNDYEAWNELAISMFFNHEKFQLVYKNTPKTINCHELANRLLRLAIEKDASEVCAILVNDAGWAGDIKTVVTNDLYFDSENCTYEHTPLSYALHCGSLQTLKRLVEFNNAAINSIVKASEGNTSVLAIAVNNNNLPALAILLSSFSLNPNEGVTSPYGISAYYPIMIALKRGYHQAAQMLILHPNYIKPIYDSNFDQNDLQQHRTLLKARNLSNQARSMLLAANFNECQRLFQEAMNIAPEVVYNDVIYLLATGKDCMQPLLKVILQCQSVSQRILELNEYIGIEIFNKLNCYPDAHKLAATFLAKARKSHDADRMLLACYFHIENKPFSPTQNTFETLLEDPKSREVILRAHIQVKLFANQLTDAPRIITDNILTLLAAEITDPISLIEFCADNEPQQSITADGTTIDNIYQRFLRLTTQTPLPSPLANSMSNMLNAIKSDDPNKGSEGKQTVLYQK